MSAAQTDQQRIRELEAELAQTRAIAEHFEALAASAVARLQRVADRIERNFVHTSDQLRALLRDP